MRKVAVILDLDGDTQSHYFEKYLREKLMVGRVISYANLPDTSKLHEDSTTLMTIFKNILIKIINYESRKNKKKEF